MTCSRGSHFLPMSTAIPLPYHADSAVYFKKIQAFPFACWLDSGNLKGGYGRYDILTAAPEKRILTDEKGTHCLQWETDSHDYKVQQETTLNEALNTLRKELSDIQNNKPPNVDLPFYGGLVGYWSYNLGEYWLNIENSDNGYQFPLMAVGVYHWAIVIDHQEKQAFFTYLPNLRHSLKEELDLLLLQQDIGSIEGAEPLIAENFAPTISKPKYLSCLSKVDDYIHAGDCYQINFTQCLEANYQGHPLTAYLKLRETLPSPFSAYLSLGDKHILSFSPERLVAVKEKAVIAQPIKGTIARDTNPETDQQNAEILQNSEKDRAENLMIVDLLRNDLSKICEYGSVSVENLFALETFPNVHHLVSDIKGKLEAKYDALDLFKACFPGGSITGAPKKRAMEIVHELEQGPREIYCGSIGYINHLGDMDMNIAIRTVTCDGEKLRVWGGGGIVADSQPEKEYEESLVKIQKILEGLSS